MGAQRQRDSLGQRDSLRQHGTHDEVDERAQGNAVGRGHPGIDRGEQAARVELT